MIDQAQEYRDSEQNRYSFVRLAEAELQWRCGQESNRAENKWSGSVHICTNDRGHAGSARRGGGSSRSGYFPLTERRLKILVRSKNSSNSTIQPLTLPKYYALYIRTYLSLFPFSLAKQSNDSNYFSIHH